MTKEDQAEGKTIYYGQIPIDLLRNPRIPMQAKALFGILHSRCREKDLRKQPHVTISQKELAECSGVSMVTIWKWLNCLRDHRWISIRRGGKGRPNEYALTKGNEIKRLDLRAKFLSLHKQESRMPIPDRVGIDDVEGS
jgi:hypothetical protein